MARQVGFVCCAQLLSGKGWLRLHTMEQSQLVGLTTIGESHGSKQGTPESALQSSSKDISFHLSFGNCLISLKEKSASSGLFETYMIEMFDNIS